MKPLKKSFSAIFSLQSGRNNYLFLFYIAGLFLVVSCNDGQSGKIPIDEARAATQVIPVKQGKEYQNTFISARNELKAQVRDSSFLEKKFRLPNAELFNRDAIGLLLNVPGADGIRVYLANDANGEQKFVLVPVDKNGADIITKLIPQKAAFTIPGVTPAYAQGDGEVVENGQTCPPCIIGGDK